eukprot:11170573-Lingulodinium_polyedra.AAC.1
MPSEGPAVLRGPIPPRVSEALRSWGPLLCAEWRAAARRMGQGPSADRVCLRVATDCSGLDAFALALGAMCIRHKHVSSCDCDPIRPGISGGKLF